MSAAVALPAVRLHRSLSLDDSDLESLLSGGPVTSPVLRARLAETLAETTPSLEAVSPRLLRTSRSNSAENLSLSTSGDEAPSTSGRNDPVGEVRRHGLGSATFPVSACGRAVAPGAPGAVAHWHQDTARPAHVHRAPSWATRMSWAPRCRLLTPPLPCQENGVQPQPALKLPFKLQRVTFAHSSTFNEATSPPSPLPNEARVPPQLPRRAQRATRAPNARASTRAAACLAARRLALR